MATAVNHHKRYLEILEEYPATPTAEILLPHTQHSLILENNLTTCGSRDIEIS